MILTLNISLKLTRLMDEIGALGFTAMLSPVTNNFWRVRAVP
jgi:hypothetical protein